MSHIWKYGLVDAQEQPVPGGEIVAVGWQGGKLCVWIQDPDLENQQLVKIVGTGWEVDLDGWRHVGSAISDALVFHVFVDE